MRRLVMRFGIVFASLIIFSSAASAQMIVELPELLERVHNLKIDIFEDSSTIDVCDIKSFFNSGGQLVGGINEKLASFKNLDECNVLQARRHRNGTKFLSVAQKGDTVVVSTVRKRGPTRLLEEYRFFFVYFPDRERVLSFRYTITNILIE